MYGRRVPEDRPPGRRLRLRRRTEFRARLGPRRRPATAPIAEQILAIQKELVTVMGELATAPQDLARYQKDGFALTTAAMVDRLTRCDRRSGKGQDALRQRLGHARQHAARRRARSRAHHLPPRRAPRRGARCRASIPTPRFCATSIASPISAGSSRASQRRKPVRTDPLRYASVRETAAEKARAWPDDYAYLGTSSSLPRYSQR